MTIYYLDPVNGNDGNDALSFATRGKTTAKTAAAQSGDTVRIIASPDPTVVGSATWDGSPGTPAQTALSISSSTNASPIVVTTSTAHGLVVGDYARVLNHTTNTNANGFWKVGAVTGTTFEILQLDGSNTTGNGAGGATGTVNKMNNSVVKLATPVNQNIALCGGLGQKPLWTPSANVTTLQLTTANVAGGYSSAQISINLTFTTGKAAYYTLPATLDLSGYQQISFAARQSTGTLVANANAVYLALCTDTTGDTVAHTAYINNITVLNGWFYVTVNFGTNLNSAIRSVAFYVATDSGAQTFQLDNIVACKAASADDSINHRSLISKNTAFDGWYDIVCINYDALILSAFGYSNASETVTTYKRETLYNTSAFTLSNFVNTGSYVTYSGGWNRTDMSTQTGETWMDGTSISNTTPVYSISGQYVAMERLNAVRASTGLFCGNAGLYNHYIISGSFVGCNTGVNYQSPATLAKFGTVYSHNNTLNFAFATNSNGVSFDVIAVASNSSSVGVNLANITNYTINSIKAANNNNNNGVAIGSYSYTGELNAKNNLSYAAAFTGSESYIGSGSSSGNKNNITFSTGFGYLYVNNFTSTEAQEALVTSSLGGGVILGRVDNTDYNSIWYTYAGNGVVSQQTTVVDSPAVSAWKLSPVSTTKTGASNPIKVKLGTIVVSAGSLVTVTARMRRTDTGLTMSLACPPGFGVTSGVKTDMTAAANTWETVTITFTPANAGGVDIYAQAYGGTTFSGYVCNMTASQA